MLGKSHEGVSVWIGLVLGLGVAWILQQPGKDKSTLGQKVQQPRSRRLLTLFNVAAVAVTKARLRVLKFTPSTLWPWACRALGTRYSPASQANRIFVLRHDNLSENLRWALELAGEAFQEVPVAIFLVEPTATYHSLGEIKTLPVVSTSEGRGSLKTAPALMEHLSKARWREWMYPEGAHELKDEFENSFGPAAMGIAYAFLFQKDMLHETVQMFCRALPWWQKLLMPVLVTGVMPTMEEHRRLTNAVSANMKLVERTFGLVERILSDGRQYLCGDSISLADIAFASLASPLILPEETASDFIAYDPRSLPREYLDIIQSLRSREGGEFVLRLYRLKRTRKGSGTARPTVRSPRRGRSFTVKKNVNSPSQSVAGRQGDRRATITQTGRMGQLAPHVNPKHRASVAA